MATDNADARHQIESVRWYHRIEIAQGLVTPGRTDSESVWRRLDLPDDMRGLRVLDIGTADGYFAFRAERAGADVIAVDLAPSPGFVVAHRLLGSRVEHRACPIWNIDVASFGTFDVVFLLGVLYHLRDPLAALHLVHPLCRGDLFVESYVWDERIFDDLPAIDADTAARLREIPLMRFFPGNTLAGDPTNFWGPNHTCLVEMLKETGYDVTATTRAGDRAYARCRPRPDALHDPIVVAGSATGHIAKPRF
ncbi:MAG: DUF1698 domain-containing protein [Vicinamibacteraceae bacterium]|nr:DUF1698 domain-containing protein [Vicinamibacteraceae bacterium]